MFAHVCWLIELLEQRVLCEELRSRRRGGDRTAVGCLHFLEGTAHLLLHRDAANDCSERDGRTHVLTA